MAVLHLSANDIARLNAAQQVLLSPLESGDSVEWQLRANHAVRHLLDADHSLFGVGADVVGPAIVTDDTDPTFPERLLSYYIGVERGDFRFRDPCMEKMGRVRRACGTGAYHQHMLCSPEEIRRSPGFREIFAPARLAHLVGLGIPLPVGEVTQFLGFEGCDVEGRSERGFALLQLLVPAFEAGVRIHRRLIARRAALASVLDGLGQGLAVYSTRGGPLHRNHALDELLAADPEAERLQECMDALARELASGWSRHGKALEGSEPKDARRSLRTRSAEYRLLGSYLPADLFGIEGVLVMVERSRPLLPTVPTLRDRFDLTAREAEIALLLAEGLTDGTIASRLFLSPHTVRRYSERVLGKLGVHSRAAVALTLLRGGESAHTE